MTKTTKTIMALLTAMTMTAGAMGTTAYAAEANTALAKDTQITNYNNEGIYTGISDLKTTIAFEDDFINYYNEFYGDKKYSVDDGSGNIKEVNVNQKLIHVYKYGEQTKFDSHMGAVFEFEKVIGGEKTTYFSIGEIILDGMPLWNTCSVFKNSSIDALNSFLEENGYKALFIENENNLYQIVYDDTSEENVIKTFLALSKKFDTGISCIHQVDEDPITNKPLLRIKGDADLSGMVDLVDLTTVAKYNLNNELYPLENETAYANADMNDDGAVNGVDTSALIENQLGKK